MRHSHSEDDELKILEVKSKCFTRQFNSFGREEFTARYIFGAVNRFFFNILPQFINGFIYKRFFTSFN